MVKLSSSSSSADFELTNLGPPCLKGENRYKMRINNLSWPLIFILNYVFLLSDSQLYMYTGYMYVCIAAVNHGKSGNKSLGKQLVKLSSPLMEKENMQSFIQTNIVPTLYGEKN